MLPFLELVGFSRSILMFFPLIPPGFSFPHLIGEIRMPWLYLTYKRWRWRRNACILPRCSFGLLCKIYIRHSSFCLCEVGVHMSGYLISSPVFVGSILMIVHMACRCIVGLKCRQVLMFVSHLWYGTIPLLFEWGSLALIEFAGVIWLSPLWESPVRNQSMVLLFPCVMLGRIIWPWGRCEVSVVFKAEWEWRLIRVFLFLWV